jgi:hypothetical protein
MINNGTSITPPPTPLDTDIFNPNSTKSDPKNIGIIEREQILVFDDEFL